jgi:glycosyltransferase involved in cell wall biosynthesis
MLLYQPVDGGVGRHVRDLAEGLTERGAEVVLCGPSLPGGLSEPPGRADHVRLELDRAIAPRASHVRLELDRAIAPRASHVRLELDRAIAPRADLAALRSFAAIVRRTRPDLIHAHSSKAGAVARLGRILQPRVPVLYTPHGYAFAGYFTSGPQRRGYREIERALAPLASRVVCVCEAEATLAAAVGAERRVRVVYNGIEPAGAGPIDPRMAELARRGPVVCALTQLRAGKGIETLIDATPIVLERHPRLQVAIWGDGPELESLRSRASAVGVGEIVHFPGASPDPLDVLRGAEVFVHPSLAEAFPYAILEAMSVARPIVASDVGGIGEALAGGESGVLVPPRDPQSLAGAVNGLLDDPDRRASLAAAGRRRVERRFSRAAMIDRLAEVYSEVTG